MTQKIIDLQEIPTMLDGRVEFLTHRIDEMKQYYFEDFGNKLQAILGGISMGSKEKVNAYYNWISTRYATIPFTELKNKAYMAPLFNAKKLVKDLGRKITEFFEESASNKLRAKQEIGNISREINATGPGAQYRLMINQYIEELQKIPGYEKTPKI